MSDLLKEAEPRLGCVPYQGVYSPDPQTQIALSRNSGEGEERRKVTPLINV
jgi:hypothetical protein